MGSQPCHVGEHNEIPSWSHPRVCGSVTAPPASAATSEDSPVFVPRVPWRSHPAAWLVVPNGWPSEAGLWGSPGCSEVTDPSPAQGLFPSPVHLVPWPQSSPACVPFSQAPCPLPTGAPSRARSCHTHSVRCHSCFLVETCLSLGQPLLPRF